MPEILLRDPRGGEGRGVGRAGRNGSVYRSRARDGRRLLLRAERVQPRDAGVSPAGIGLQALHLCGRARQWLYAVERCARRARRDRAACITKYNLSTTY